MPPCDRGRAPAQLDDEEAISGPYDHAAAEVSGHHDEAVSRPSVRLGNRRQRVPAGRLTALTTKLGDETDALAVQGAHRLARAKPLRRRASLRRLVGRCGARSIHAHALRGRHYWCFNHGLLPVIADALTAPATTAPTRARVGGLIAGPHGVRPDEPICSTDPYGAAGRGYHLRVPAFGRRPLLPGMKPIRASSSACAAGAGRPPAPGAPRGT